MIQPHFDYTFSAWYPNSIKSLKKKLHNQYIHFCLKLNNKDHTGLTEFEKINWLPINDRFKQCISSITFKFFNNRNLVYTSEVFKQAGHPNTNTRVSFVKLNQPYQNTNHGQKAISYLLPNIWNSLPVSLKATDGLNTYKHKILQTKQNKKSFSRQNEK